MTEIRFEPTPEQEKSLLRLEKETGTKTSDYILELLAEHLEDLECIRIAEERLANPGKIWTHDEIKRGADLES